MCRRHDTAVRFIERAMTEHSTAPVPHMTAAAVQMAIELSYAQGDIGDDEYTAFTNRYNRLTGYEPMRRIA